MNDKLRKAALIKQQLLEADAKKKKVFRWITFGVQLWAIRMAFAMFGMTIPFGISFLNNVFPVTNSISYTSKVSCVSWFDVVKSEFKLITKTRNHAVPLVISEVPLISSLSLRMFFEKSLPLNAIQAKISSREVFVHFSSDRLWAGMYNLTAEHHYISMSEYASDAFHSRNQFLPFLHLDQLRDDFRNGDCVDAGHSSCDSGYNSKGLQYMYSTFTPLSPYISSLVPSLSHLYYSQSTDAQVSLWMSSPGSIAALHYDMEDNFLLQIAGNKTVLLVAPEALACVRPHSSLHPYWRQSQLGRETVTPKALYAVLHLNESCYNRTTTSAPVIWEVELRVGDMVYIPAGYFHSVTAGRDSLSVNSWFSSSMSEVYASLLSAHLPFEPSDSLPVKLASLSTLIRKVVVNHGLLSSYEAFVDSLKSRYSELVHDSVFQCRVADIESICPSSELVPVESSRLIMRASNQVYSLMTHTKLTSGVMSLLLEDYIEDVVQSIVATEALTPCFLFSFVTQCF